MIAALQILAVLLAAIAMATALAHALEFPGKLRLDREQYQAVQTIYYPGFTFAGIAEPLAVVAAAVLLVVTPRGSPAFWLTLVAALGLAAMQAVYWLVTHPVNKVWLEGEKLGKAGSTFFGLDPTGTAAGGRPAAWTDLRDRWEYSHVARAALAFVSFLALVVADSGGFA